MATLISIWRKLNFRRLKTVNLQHLNGLAITSSRYCTSKVYKEPDPTDEEDEISKIRNVSRMPPHLRATLMGESFTFQSHEPYLAPWVTPHKTKKIQRKFFGKYGKASNVDPSILWPSHRELDEMEQIEKEFFPSLQEMMENVKKEKEEYEVKKRQRYERITENCAKLESWMNDLKMRQQKSLDDARAQKEKKEKLIEDVRAHFGYRVDPKDERFQEMLLQKEKEEKKAAKEARKKEKIAKELAKLNALAEKAKKELEKKENKEKSDNISTKEKIS